MIPRLLFNSAPFQKAREYQVASTVDILNQSLAEHVCLGRGNVSVVYYFLPFRLSGGITLQPDVLLPLLVET